jgi:hypothetical protein
LDIVPGRRWPLHPRPREWEVLHTWVRRIAGAYGVGYDTFLCKALGRTGPGARDLETITEAQLAMLAVGTGVSVEQLRGMNTAAIMGRLTAKIADWMLTEEGRDGLAQIRTTIRLMTDRLAEHHTINGN